MRGILEELVGLAVVAIGRDAVAKLIEREGFIGKIQRMVARIVGGKPKHPSRGHWNKSGVMFLVGRGIKPGISLGETDEIGFQVIKDPAQVHDLNATILHLLGIDHLRLTHRFQGRDFRLTDVYGKVVQALLAGIPPWGVGKPAEQRIVKR